MTFIKTIPAAAATGEVRVMYERQEAAWGYVPDYAKAFCHRPEVMEHWGKMLAAIKRPVDARRRELVTLAVAIELRHSPCSLAHGAELARIVGKDVVLTLAAGEECAALSESERAMIRFARRIATDAAQIGIDEVTALRELHGFSDAEIFDIAAIAASRCFFTKILDALGTQADSPNMDLDADLRHALTVGRPISQQPPENLPQEESS